MNKKPDKNVCLRCSGPMEPGYIQDTEADQIGSIATRWVSGHPKQMRPRFMNGERVNLSGTQRYVIDAYRCTLCGLLELYALSDHTSNQSYE